MKAGRATVALLSITLFGGDQSPEQLYGQWKVTALATAGPVTAMSGEAAARLIGHILIITPHKLQFARQTCHPTYESSKESLAEIAQSYKIDAKKLNFPDPVLRYDLDCTEVFTPEPGKIVFSWKGYLFRATKSSAAITDRRDSHKPPR